MRRYDGPFSAPSTIRSIATNALPALANTSGANIRLPGRVPCKRKVTNRGCPTTFQCGRRLKYCLTQWWCLKVILTALFHIDYQACLATKPDLLDKYRDFAVEIARRMQRQGVQLANGGQRLDSPEFYRGDTAFVSLNYDPIALWMQFIAHRALNNSPAVPHAGSPAVPLHLYHDFGHMIPARGIDRREAQWPWYPLNEAAAQRLNEQKYLSGYRVRLTKF